LELFEAFLVSFMMSDYALWRGGAIVR
jgi:hypothetical protein